MTKYALIKNNIVANTVIWDGKGGIFADYTTVEITDDVPVQIGDAYVNSSFYEKPRDGYLKNWNG